jgi:Domain of unknown function (DUF6398)
MAAHRRGHDAAAAPVPEVGLGLGRGERKAPGARPSVGLAAVVPEGAQGAAAGWCYDRLLGMGKGSPPVDPKAALDALAADLVSRTSAFCQAHLDDEYGALCAKLIATLRRKRVVPFATGRPAIWAASIVYALGQINFTFDRTQTPHTTPDTIASFFGVSKVTVGLKAKVIRDLLKLRPWDKNFSIAAVEASNPFRDLRMMDGLIVPVSLGSEPWPPRQTSTAAPKPTPTPTPTLTPTPKPKPMPTESTARQRLALEKPLLEVFLSDEEYKTLCALNVPGAPEASQQATQTDEGIVLELSRSALTDLVGWVAGEANHARRGRRCDLLHAIADAMEAALSQPYLAR